MTVALNRARTDDRDQASPLRGQKSAMKNVVQMAAPADDSEIVAHLKRKLHETSIEMERLRNEMIGMARSLDQKEERVRHLEHRIN